MARKGVCGMGRGKQQRASSFAHPPAKQRFMETNLNHLLIRKALRNRNILTRDPLNHVRSGKPEASIARASATTVINVRSHADKLSCTKRARVQLLFGEDCSSKRLFPYALVSHTLESLTMGHRPAILSSQGTPLAKLRLFHPTQSGLTSSYVCSEPAQES